MGIYIGGWVFNLLFFMKWRLKESQKRKIFLIGTALIIGYIWIFRSVAVGTDTHSYITYFQLYKEHTLKELLFGNFWFKQMEPLFIVISKAILFFVADEYACLQGIGVLYTLLLLSVLFRLKDKELYIFAFAFYGFYVPCTGLNTMRQAFAMLLVMHAFIEFRNEKNFRAIVFSVLAVLTQYGAALPVLVLIVFMITKRDSKKAAKRMQALVILGSLVGCMMFEFLFARLGLTSYLGNERQAIGMIKFITAICIYSCYRLSFPDIDNRRSDKEIQLLNTILLLTMLMNVLGIVSSVFIRFASFLIPFSAIAATDIFSAKDININTSLAIKTVCFISVNVFFFHSLINNIGEIVPFTVL